MAVKADTAGYADLARRFVESIGRGEIDVTTCGETFSAWTLSSGDMPGEKFRAGVRMLGSLFPAGLDIRVILSITDGTNVALQARSHGVLSNGLVYENDYVFMFSFADDRIASVREYTDTKKVAETIHPLMKELLATRAIHQQAG